MENLLRDLYNPALTFDQGKFDELAQKVLPYVDSDLGIVRGPTTQASNEWLPLSIAFYQELAKGILGNKGANYTAGDVIDLARDLPLTLDVSLIQIEGDGNAGKFHYFVKPKGDTNKFSPRIFDISVSMHAAPYIDSDGMLNIKAKVWDRLPTEEEKEEFDLARHELYYNIAKYTLQEAGNERVQGEDLDDEAQRLLEEYPLIQILQVDAEEGRYSYVLHREQQTKVAPEGKVKAPQIKRSTAKKRE